MSSFDDVFDARAWFQENGGPESGTAMSMTLQPDRQWLSASVYVSSAASWEIPELGIGQSAWRHDGFRGTLFSLLERSRRDVERSKDLYSESLWPEFDSVIHAIGDMLSDHLGYTAIGDLQSDCKQMHLKIRDSSGLSYTCPELEQHVLERKVFCRSEAENIDLGVWASELPDSRRPATQLKTPEELALLVRQSRRIAALTGAGISVESGITPFRNPSAGDEGSFWGTFDASRMTVQNFNSDELVREEWWAMKRMLMKESLEALPNSAHMFFATLQERGQLSGVITQNIDSLHLKSGVASSNVIELHGHMRGLICSDKRTHLNPLPYRQGNCSFDLSDDPAVGLAYQHQGVPLCLQCGAPLRSETVFFGQPMPEQEVDRARDLIYQCDLLFVVGSTLLVAPANELPALAIRLGIPVVIINFDSTKYDDFATALVRHKAGEFLKEVSMHLLQSDPLADQTTNLNTATSQVTTICSLPHAQAEGKVYVEANKRAKEFVALSQTYGSRYFCAALIEPDGQLEALKQAMNTVIGTYDTISVMLFSANKDQLCIVARVAQDVEVPLSCKDWLDEVISALGVALIDYKGDDHQATLVIGACSQTDLYPLKLRDVAVNLAVQVLNKRKLLPYDDDDEEDFIFGDHDFPLV